MGIGGVVTCAVATCLMTHKKNKKLIEEQKISLKEMDEQRMAQKQAIDSKNEIISNKNTEIEEKRKHLDKLEINMSDEERTIAQKEKIIVAQELELKALETESITLALVLEIQPATRKNRTYKVL